MLIICLLADLLVPFILAVYYPRYSHINNVMSDLGSEKSPVAKWYNIWLIIWGIVFIISALQTISSYYNFSANLAISAGILVTICGVGGVISGFFPISSDKDVETRSDKIHGISSGFGFIALAFFPYVSYEIYDKIDVPFLSTVSLFVFALGIVLFILFILSKDIIGNSGLWQRLHLSTYYFLLILIALYELRVF